jgi:hypothetical protein
MIHRRTFLGSAMLAPILASARAGIGEIRYCRVADAEWLGFVPRGCICEVDPAAEGATLLGSRATLVIHRDGWNVYGTRG